MKSVLVVDDEFGLTGTLRAVLEGEGYRVDTFSNGKEAEGPSWAMRTSWPHDRNKQARLQAVSSLSSTIRTRRVGSADPLRF
jgi:CheY-like chemotaxis protein